MILNYSDTQLQDVLNKILPNSVLKSLKSENIGNIKIIEFTYDQEIYKRQIAEVHIDKLNFEVIAQKKLNLHLKDPILKFFDLYNCEMVLSSHEMVLKSGEEES